MTFLALSPTMLQRRLGKNEGRPYAAKKATEYSITVGGVTYSDWFLPSVDELREMYKNKSLIGGFKDGSKDSFYWSSSEYLSRSARTVSFKDGTETQSNKNYIGDPNPLSGYPRGNPIRVIRAF